jgi:hypothetical protein
MSFFLSLYHFYWDLRLPAEAPSSTGRPWPGQRVQKVGSPYPKDPTGLLGCQIHKPLNIADKGILGLGHPDQGWLEVAVSIMSASPVGDARNVKISGHIVILIYQKSIIHSVGLIH